MSQANIKNTAIFVTVLSVYLGLTLIGAPPHILAQAASTKIVDFQTEPNDDEKFKDKFYPEFDKDIQAVENFKLSQSIIFFFEDLKNLQSFGKISSEDLTFLSDSKVEKCETKGTILQITDISNIWLETAIKEFVSKAVGDELDSLSESFSKSDGISCRETGFKVELNEQEFSLTITFKKAFTEKCRIFAEEINRIFLDKTRKSANFQIKKIYENTKARAENNQVFIVTRLPRASIEKFLKEDTEAGEEK